MPELVKVDYRPPVATYVVEFEDGREAFLTIREDLDPLRVYSASTTGVPASEDVSSTVIEASDWLINCLRNA